MMGQNNITVHELEKASAELQDAHSKFLAVVKGSEAKSFLRWFLINNGYDKKWVDQSINSLYDEFSKRKQSKENSTNDE